MSQRLLGKHSLLHLFVSTLTLGLMKFLLEPSLSRKRVSTSLPPKKLRNLWLRVISGVHSVPHLSFHFCVLEYQRLRGCP